MLTPSNELTGLCRKNWTNYWNIFFVCVVELENSIKFLMWSRFGSIFCVGTKLGSVSPRYLPIWKSKVWSAFYPSWEGGGVSVVKKLDLAKLRSWFVAHRSVFTVKSKHGGAFHAVYAVSTHLNTDTAFLVITGYWMVLLLSCKTLYSRRWSWTTVLWLNYAKWGKPCFQYRTTNKFSILFYRFF